MNGQLEFFSADDFEVLNAAEHFMCTHIQWDPTGRYVATSVTHIHQMENGFNMWLFNGTILYRCLPACRDAAAQLWHCLLYICAHAQSTAQMHASQAMYSLNQRPSRSSVALYAGQSAMKLLWIAHRVLRDQFYQFDWRPRRPSLLSKEQEADLAKRLKEYSKRYDEEDSKLLEEVCPGMGLPHACCTILSNL